MNILLIEDEQRIADFIVAGFTDVGFKTHWEQDGFRGLNTALIKNFDAIVLDLTLPMMDGLTVLAEIRRKNLALPVIILSARTDLTDRLQGFELMLSPGQIFSRQQILKQVWQIDFDPGTNVVDVCVQRLRKKLTDDKMPEGEQFPIETIRGVGYRFNNY
ncbi:MAG: response regulator transcription factor [Limnohabitans sp.]|nr:response regulator transcription factor [Limnohabitans sp.]